MNVIQRIAKNTAALFAAQTITTILSLILSILIARILGDTEFGKYSFVLAFTALFGVFIGIGYSTLLIREVSRNKSLANEYFSNVAAIYLVMSIIIYIAMVFVVNLVQYPTDTKILVYLFGIYTVLTAFASLYRVIFRVFETMEYELFTVLIKEIARVSFGIIILMFGFGLRELAIIFIFSGVLDIMAGFLISTKKFIRIKIKFDINFWNQTYKIAIPLTLLSLFHLIYVRIDTVMLSILKGDTVVGWYNAAYNLVLGLGPFSQWFMNALFPLTSTLFISSIKSLKFAYEKSFKYLLILGLPISIGITILANRFILFFYGPTFSNSVIALRILSFDVLLIFMFQPLAFILTSMDKQKQIAIIAGIGALLNVVLNLILIPYYSYIGAAYATILTETIIIGILFYLVSKYLCYLPLHRILISPIVSVGIMAFFIYFVEGINLILLIILSISIYFLMLYLTKGISSDDIALFKRLLKLSKKT